MNQHSNIPTVTSGGGHTHGISDVTGLQAALAAEGGGGGASNFDDLLDYDATTPSEGDLIVVGVGGSGVKNVANTLTDLDANEFLVGVGVGSDAVPKTVAEVQAILGIDKAALVYNDSAPVDGTVVVCVRAPFAMTINSLTTDVDSGTVSVVAQINGTNITGLAGPVSVTSTKATTNATAANTVAVGDEISLTFSSASTPVGFRATLNATRG